MFLHKLFCITASILSLQGAVILPTLLPPPAFAIPKKDAIAKLNNIVVYVITASNDDFVFTQQGEFSIVKVFMSKDDALSELASLQKLDRMLRASLKRYTLDDLYPIIESASKSLTESTTRKFIFPIINDSANTDKAREILLSQGLSQDVITKNLRIPVFYTEPMLNMTFRRNQNQQTFFTDFAVLDSFLAKLNPTRFPKIKVLNLDQVLEIIIEERKDRFQIYPNAQYFKDLN